MSQQLQKTIKPRRPILRYHGGKWRLASWIISYFPKHTRYVEPYCGAANILLKKDRVHAEIINDLNDEVINLFKVLQCHWSRFEVANLVKNTPYASNILTQAQNYNNPSTFGDEIEMAVRFLVRSHMGFNVAALNTGFRSNSTRKGSLPVHNWRDFPPIIKQVGARLQGVIIYNEPAITTMERHDCEDTLHFIDPPYLPETRSSTSKYVNDMDEVDHLALLEAITRLKGMVVLCGYKSALYTRVLEEGYGWKRVEKQTFTAQKTKRTECLWLNPHCQKRLLEVKQ